MNLRDQQLFSHVVAPPDRRRDLRYSVQVQIELREDGSEVPMRMNTTDLSRGGCYVELLMPLPVGTDVTATLWLSNGSVRMRGRVVTRHAQFGNGIKFLDFDDNGEKVLAQYLDAINPFPE
jgi:c-di-GMP-binding flagellar brake protein YcgR